MALLRVKAYQPFACYRKPFSYGFWDTFPLPPFSTILGWVHWVIEASEPLPMNIGVAGKFESITYDLQRLVKFDRVRKGEKQTILEGFRKALSNSPTYTANVTNINLRIYVEMDTEYLEAFRNKIMLRNYPSLGRYEDLLRIDDAKFVTPTKKAIGNFDRPIPIDYATYLTPEMAQLSGCQGSTFYLPFYHDMVEGKRFFKKEKAIFLDSGYFDQGEFLFDDEADEIFNSPVVISLFGKYRPS